MASYPNFQPSQQEPPSGPPAPSWGQVPGVQPPTEGPTGAPGVGTRASIDVIDNADELWVYVDLPGFKEEEIRIEGDEGILHVTAERLDEIEQGRQVVVKERAARMERTIPLTVPVNVDNASASYEDGVCKVTLPKTATERYKQIDISS